MHHNRLIYDTRRAVLIMRIVSGGLVACGGFALIGTWGEERQSINVIAVNAICLGVLLACFAYALSKGRSIEEAYRLGYDLGFENGYRSGREAEPPVVPNGRPHRVVIDLKREGRRTV